MIKDTIVLTNEEKVSVKGKYIEEMAKTIDDNIHYYSVFGKPTMVSVVEIAKILYNAGYRKQSEGHWIDKPTGAYSRMQSWCSACGKHSGIGGIESNRHKPYCPNCGAKMTRKEDEGK